MRGGNTLWLAGQGFAAEVSSSVLSRQKWVDCDAAAGLQNREKNVLDGDGRHCAEGKAMIFGCDKELTNNGLRKIIHRAYSRLKPALLIGHYCHAIFSGSQPTAVPCLRKEKSF